MRAFPISQEHYGLLSENFHCYFRIYFEKPAQQRTGLKKQFERKANAFACRRHITASATQDQTQ